jgi:uncharacterized membrane protein
MKKWLGFVFCISVVACVNNTQQPIEKVDSTIRVDTTSTTIDTPIRKDTTPVTIAKKPLPVTYIARGNEPGWIVTIVENKYIKYVGDYGQDSALFPYMKPVFNKRLLFKTYKGDRSLQVEFYKQTCTDDAGRKYPYLVKINVSGSAEYRGCGEIRNAPKP